MLNFLEVEEFVGKHWHRWAAADSASYPRHPDAVVALEEVRNVLGVFFRAGGGPHGVTVGAITARYSRHRLSFRQRLGLDEEPVDQARRDEENVLLPPQLDYFPSREQNRDHYFWLTAFLALTEKPAVDKRLNPLQWDIVRLREVERVVNTIKADFPGLYRRYQGLCQAMLTLRPKRRLPESEAAIEAVIRSLLGDEQAITTEHEAIFQAVRDPAVKLKGFKAPVDYRPPLPLPLWGEAIHLGTGKGPVRNDDEDEGGTTASPKSAKEGKHKADRRHQDQSERDDPLVLNRFEKILSWAEMVNVNRMVEDDEDEEAKRAADQIEEMTLSPHKQRAATRLKVDLDLAPGTVTGESLRGTYTYPEWNFRKEAYLPSHCAVLTDLQSEEGEDWEPDEATRRRIRQVRRQFEALRPRREMLRAQIDGPDLDMDAMIRSRCDLHAVGEGSDLIYQATRTQARDLAVAILVDTSLSTDAWLQDRRVLDVEKEALLVLAHGIDGCGDDYGIFTFTSHRRHRVWVNTVKGFEEPLRDVVTRRIGALRPGHYTRMGPAIRHVTRELEKRPNRNKLLLVLTDGKPNDTDYYEGRYGIEDTRKAVLEAQRKSLTVFGVTIDSEAQQYFPYLFGRAGYAIVNRPDHLASALPAIYRNIIAQ
jgi:nitric oxide reductase NorD protein